MTVRFGCDGWGGIRRRAQALAGVACLVSGRLVAAEVDAWVGDAGADAGAAPRAGFERLVASAPESEAGMLVDWVPSGESQETGGGALDAAAAGVVLEASTGSPGHWPSRDWRRWPMVRRGEAWRVVVPLGSDTEPVVYRVRRGEGAEVVVSPARVFRPALSERPVVVVPFQGLIDGFEDGIGGWSGAVPGVSGGISATTNALTGRGGLRMEVPAGRASMTVGTVRVQGWMLVERAPRAVRFAARTEGGEGKVGCRLHGHAGTDRVSVFPTKAEFSIGPEWRRLEVPLEAFVGLRPLEVDWMTIQFRAESGRALLVDDVELVPR